MGLTIAVDFGSTYTKVVAVNLEKEELIGVVQSPSTVDTDMTIAFQKAMEQLQLSNQYEETIPERIVASSSAAGGLNVVAVGLVRDLTAKAAEEAALGAGAKLTSTYAYGLSVEDIKKIEDKPPDMILLTGGTDGGNRECIVSNATLLAKSTLSVPIIVAGNRLAAGEARKLLEASGKEAIVVENVLPELDRLNIEPTRTMIRETFMKRIIHAKGLDKAHELVGRIIMPTPTAVLMGARLLAEGTDEESGIGDLVLVDVGGATTDIDSISHGDPSDGDAIVKGLQEPYLKRTVEGDLGIRYNADTILQKMGRKKLMDRIALVDESLLAQLDVDAAVKRLSCNVEYVPEDDFDYCIDAALACISVETAMERHCGRIKEVYLPTGNVKIQHGKDLSSVKNLIGTGGVFAYGRHQRIVLESACFNKNRPESLRPRSPEFFIDNCYILFAIGLLSDVCPTAALRIIKKHLKKI